MRKQFVLIITVIICLVSLSYIESKASESNYEMSDAQISKVISFPKGSFKFNPFNRPMLSGSYYCYQDSINKLNVSFIIQKRSNSNTEEEIIKKMMRDDALMGTLTRQEQKVVNGMHTYIFHFSKFGGKEIDQLNTRSIVFFDDSWLDIHISMMNPKDDALDKFLSFIGNVKIDNKPNKFVSELDSVYQDAALYCFVYGNEAYKKKDYKMAISAYTALMSILVQVEMNHDYSIVAYDNLGMAYALLGDLKKAKYTFEQGVKFDPNYPNFYYNLGCCYAESGDNKSAVEYLEKAFARRSHVLPGESMPNPFTDDSFKKMLQDKDIRAKVEALTK